MAGRKRLKPRKTPVQGRSIQTVDAILEGAAQVFARRGYADATTNHIAERAGVSIGSLYQYFPNKDAILVALLENHIEEGRELIVRMMSEVQDSDVPPEKILRTFIEAMMDLHKENPRLHRVLFEEAPWPRHLHDRLSGIESLAAQGVEGLLSGNQNTRTKRPGIAAHIIVHVIESLTHHFVLYSHEEVDRGELMDEMVDMLSRYLFR